MSRRPDVRPDPDTRGGDPSAGVARSGPSWREPWGWVASASVLVLLARAWGAPLGEPAADDFHFLHRALLASGVSLLDGGGAVIYWRPLSRQVYFELLGPVMLAWPRAVALLHAALLGLVAMLLYRTLRHRWSAARCAAAASFPLIAESTRALLLWPSTFQDLGALLFSVLALHEAARRRLGTALAALLAGLLCKEIVVVTALLLPWLPSGPRDRRQRLRWAAASAAMVALWGAAYGAVMRHAGLLFQRDLETDTPALAGRVLWALGHGLDDAFSLGSAGARIQGISPASPTPGLVAAALLAAALVAALFGRWLAAGRRRARGRGSGPGARPGAAAPWVAWGLLWFGLSTATLGETFPLWGPFRSAFGTTGLGIALVAAFGALGSPWLGGLVGLRLVTLLLSAAPPSNISQAPYGPGLPMDFPSLVRLSRYAGESRAVLLARHPTLPRGAAVGRHHRPLMAEHAFADYKALQVWYRDTTLRWVPWGDLVARPDDSLDAILEYEPHEARQMALIEPQAMRRYLEALRRMGDLEWRGAIASLDQADSLQRDRGARVFLGTLAGKRSLGLLGLGDSDGAGREAERSLRLWRDGADSRYVAAALLAGRGRLQEAEALLDTVLKLYPFDESASTLREELRAEAKGRGLR